MNKPLCRLWRSLESDRVRASHTIWLLKNSLIRKSHKIIVYFQRHKTPTIKDKKITTHREFARNESESRSEIFSNAPAGFVLQNGQGILGGPRDRAMHGKTGYRSCLQTPLIQYYPLLTHAHPMAFRPTMCPNSTVAMHFFLFHRLFGMKKV